MVLLSGFLITKSMVTRRPCIIKTTYQFTTYPSLQKKQPYNLKGKNVTSQKWLTRQLKDPYVKRAQHDNYRCRSAFKLLEINEKHNILIPGNVVVDCGSAPGSWTQVAVQKVNALGQDPDKPKGVVIAVDLLFFPPIEGATILANANFMHLDTQKNITHILSGKKVDLVMSDMAPKATGVKTMDHELIIELCTAALSFSFTVLREGGTFLCKLWQGGEQHKLETVLHKFFSHLKVVKPHASRHDSAEIFLLAKNFNKEGLKNATYCK